MPKHARTNDSDFKKPEETVDEKVTTQTSSEGVLPEIDETNANDGAIVDIGPLSSDQNSHEEDVSNGIKKHMTIHEKKSQRMRRVLIAVLVLIFILIGALGYFTYLLFQETQTQASQQTLSQGSTDVDELKEGETLDSASSVKKEIEAPPLVSVLGKTQVEALQIIERGATVISATVIDDESNPIKSSVKVSLTDEPSAARSGTPMVFLDLNAEGQVISAGYSAAASLLGFGSTSFSDAIEKKQIIEKTFAEAGLMLPEGAVVLPRDKTLYSTYATDGTTLTNEQFSFVGTVEQNGAAFDWSAVLRYDYTAANSTGNLANTVRQIYIYVSAPGVSASISVEETPAE